MRFLLPLVLLFSVSTKASTTLPVAFDHSHGKFDGLLGDFTSQKDGQTWVDYQGLKARGRGDLQTYLRALSAVTPAQYQGFTGDQRLAFLINAYNAFTLEWILIHHPVRSIKDTGSLLSSPWKKVFPGYRLLGSKFTLDNIEHERIRVEFKEPRIHFAVNCASIGCPSLRPKAFTGAGLQAELAETELAFFRNPGKFFVKNKTVHLSAILDWYGEDFEAVFGSVEAYVVERAKFYGVAGDLPAQNIDIEFLDYDWKLNGK
jgi:hypothetical protein